MTCKYFVMAGFEGKVERVALECDPTMELNEIVVWLNKVFSRTDSNLWQDSFGQQFSIRRVEEL